MSPVSGEVTSQNTDGAFQGHYSQVWKRYNYRGVTSFLKLGGQALLLAIPDFQTFHPHCKEVGGVKGNNMLT